MRHLDVLFSALGWPSLADSPFVLGNFITVPWTL
jgi:hypothetical protein